MFLRVGVCESLFKLAFGLDPGILHVLEVLAHVLHLILQLMKVLVLSLLLLYHYSKV